MQVGSARRVAGQPLLAGGGEHLDGIEVDLPSRSPEGGVSRTAPPAFRATITTDTLAGSYPPNGSTRFSSQSIGQPCFRSNILRFTCSIPRIAVATSTAAKVADRWWATRPAASASR